MDKFYNITGNGIVTIPNPTNPRRRWYLKRIVINTKGASSNVATLYDSDEDTGANAEQRIGAIDTTVQPGFIDYDLILQKGIYIVLATGTAANLTVIYKEI